MNSTRRRIVWAVLCAAVALLAVIIAARFMSAWPSAQSGTSSAVAPSGGPAAVPAGYRCPMHPAMVSDRPGDCPICGMRMVPRADRGAEAGGSEAGRKKIVYRSTMNPNEVSDKPGKDSMGMDMVPF
ncbi:MAG TPA: heavy metal-binding domain-containing protein, partial [Candidatus Polarisedimenticolia bacterium]|nr:heavy metal-binding domain-containing protein [Candidatus Polarisedimenticolia bacterium]